MLSILEPYTKPKIGPLVQACEAIETGFICICRLLAMAVLAVASCAGRVDPAGAAEHSRSTKVQLVSWCPLCS